MRFGRLFFLLLFLASSLPGQVKFSELRGVGFINLGGDRTLIDWMAMG